MAGRGEAGRGEAARHIPVLAREAVAYLAPERGGVFVDCTVGLGGHAASILQHSADCRLLGIDRDPEALAIARERLSGFGDRITLVEGGFERLEALMTESGVASAAGVLADLGVSSLQLDEAMRGFSFQRDGPLDMRMGGDGITAETVINEYEELELEKIFREYGEERQARRVARAVVAARARERVTRTDELRRIVARAKAGSGKRHHSASGGRGIDPATQVFQAVRIEVNRELENLDELLDQAVRLLEPDGRLVVISYHSLEDRAVKNHLRNLASGDRDPITGRPLAETQLLDLLTRKPVRPSDQEIADNPRSRSARLRAARKK